MDGCEAHHVQGKAVAQRWVVAERMPWNSATGVCRCCLGPCLLAGFDERGVGLGDSLCSRCRSLEEVKA